ncbi:MAG: ATP-binding cassette domain-containing protein [Magnetococcales bacterium]|nr:ATP-binding cassette domain-containing protein [Magnetococcales bacterium]
MNQKAPKKTTLKMVGGLPQGTTVALVGDPGTGKTTFLLEYYKRAILKNGQIEFEENKPLKKLDHLLRHSKQKPESSDKEASNKEASNTLRCFVSLESSFSRMAATHGHFFQSENGQEHSDNKQTKSDDKQTKSVDKQTKSDDKQPPPDQFIFIDATSFLSGRVEDELRYPHLASQATGHSNNGINFTLYNFSMEEETSGGGSALRFLDESDNHAIRPRELGEIIGSCTSAEHNQHCSTPFCLKHTSRAFMLMTRPLPDPRVRIRLLKDLLAEIFSRFRKYQKRLVIFDSLSALLDNFVGEGTTLEPAGRRLHILNLIRWLEDLGVTTLFSSEAVRDDGHTLRRQPLFLGTQERYLASGVIQLDYHQYRSGDLIRYFRILKMRGASHDMRPHAYDINSEGIAWVEPLFGERDEEGL